MPLRTSIVLRNPPRKKRKTKVKKTIGVKKMATRKKRRRRRRNQVSLVNPTKRRRTRRKRRRNPLSVGRGRVARRPKNMVVSNPRRRKRYKKRRNPARRRTYRRNQFGAMNWPKLQGQLMIALQIAIGGVVGKMGSSFIRDRLPEAMTAKMGNWTGLIGVGLGLALLAFGPKKMPIVKNIGMGMMVGGTIDIIDTIVLPMLPTPGVTPEIAAAMAGDLYPYGSSSHALMGADTSLLGSGASIYGADTSLLGHEQDPYDIPAI